MSGTTPGPWSYFSSSGDAPASPEGSGAVPETAPAQSAPVGASGGATAAPAPWESGWEEPPTFTPTPGPAAADIAANSPMGAWANPVNNVVVGAGDAAMRGLSDFVRPLAGGLGYLAGLSKYISPLPALFGVKQDPETAEAYKNAMENLTNYHTRTTLGHEISAVPSKIITAVAQGLSNPAKAPIAEQWLGQHFGKEFTHEVLHTFHKYGPMALQIFHDSVPGTDPESLATAGEGLTHLAKDAYQADQHEADKLADEGHPLAATALGAGPKMALRAAE